MSIGSADPVGPVRGRAAGEAVGSPAPKQLRRLRDGGLLAGIFLALTLGILFAGRLYYRSHEARFRSEVEKQLSAIAELKVAELMQFRKERLGDGELLSGNSAFSLETAALLRRPGDAAARLLVMPWLEKLQGIYGYDRVSLLDAGGRRLLAVPPTDTPLAPAVLGRLPEVLASSRPTLIDFFRAEENGRVYLDLMVPVSDPSGQGQAIGAVLLRIDPESYLYPFLKRWPTSSRTAETLLVRRDGNDALFLNELRFQKGTALSFRIPLDRLDTPAVRAALGRSEVMGGIDYRGVPVFSAVRPVPDSPWALVARMDVEEALAPVRETLWLVALLAGALILASGTGLAAVWRHQSSRFYRAEAEAAEALRLSGERFRELHEKMMDAFVRVDMGGHIVDWNASYREMVGYRDDEIARLTYVDLTPERWHEMESRILNEQVLARGYSDLYLKEYRRKDGFLIEVELRTILSRDAAGDPAGMWAIIRDVTERTRAEQALRESEAKYRVLFESMSEGVALHEMVYGETGEAVDYRLLEINPAYEEHTGLAREKACGVLARELYGAGAPPYLAEYEQVVRTGEPFLFETYFPPLKRHFRISVVRQKPGHFATVFEDVTTRKRQEEELKAKNAEMERFTYLVSHDLKSPLVTVKTFLGYLEEDLKTGDTARIEKDRFFLRSATDKMGRLLEDLLELSRVGRVVHPSVQVTLSELVAEATEAVAGRIAELGVEVRRAGDDLVLFGDRPRLAEIWQNLLDNSVKYMGGQRAPRIEIGVEGSGREAVFSVRDNGIGIDPRFQGKVFGLFEKLDPETEGTGLGLALVKRVVEVYGGRIWLESGGEGRGTCVSFTLPGAVKSTMEGVPR